MLPPVLQEYTLKSKDSKQGGMEQTKLFLNSSIATENITVPYGTTWLTDLVFEALGLNGFLDSLKRDQGVRISAIVSAMVSFSSSELRVGRFESTSIDVES